MAKSKVSSSNPITDRELAMAFGSKLLPKKSLSNIFEEPGRVIKKAVDKARESGLLAEFSSNKAETLELAQMRIMDAFSNKDLDCESTKDLVSAFKSFGEVAKKEKSETMNSMAILSNIIAQVTNARLRGGNIVDTSVIQGIEIDPWQDIEFKLE